MKKNLPRSLRNLFAILSIIGLTNLESKKLNAQNNNNLPALTLRYSTNISGKSPLSIGSFTGPNYDLNSGKASLSTNIYGQFHFASIGKGKEKNISLLAGILAGANTPLHKGEVQTFWGSALITSFNKLNAHITIGWNPNSIKPAGISIGWALFSKKKKIGKKKHTNFSQRFGPGISQPMNW